ncbi:hypothetical protein A8924_7099 [Saccharopolyspora erythraea NRRL 2338]|nr:hypothetical protein N599_08390 [Saccharopolyspora erythraea D]PFG99550.1 hypothetical protein A8924_7099 [Saccharopolyspora erythraea NRRL 2338]
MWPNPYRVETPMAFWIVGVGEKVRHATDIRPGAAPAGDWIPTLCEVWIRVPFSTVIGQEPKSKDVTERCPNCTEAVSQRKYRDINWDF